MKFIKLEVKGEKSHYINVGNISYVQNNMGFADIYMLFSNEPIKTGVQYEEVMKLIINAPNF